MQQTSNHRNSMWAYLLILVGAIWLLTELKIVSSASLAVLFRFWPLLLIAVGLQLLYGRRSTQLGLYIGLGTIAVVVVLMLVGPALGLAPSTEVKTGTYATEENADMSSADIEVQATVENIQLSPSNSNTLFTADIEYFMNPTFSDEGSRVSLREEGSVNFGLPFLMITPTTEWNVAVARNIPVDLTIGSGTGNVDLNLADLELQSLNVNGGTGNVNASLPNMESSYDATFSTGTGNITIELEDNTAVEIRISGGTGNASVDVPNDAAVRVQGSTGTGSIRLPANLNFRRVSGSDENVVGDSGTWETEGFATAERQIIIHFEGGTGGLEVR